MRIAILEDDEAQRELMKSWLEASKHNCEVYSSGEAFRKALKQNTHDLLILDWNLPDTTGVDVLKWVRSSIDKTMPILFITSRDDEKDIVTALNFGADDYMTKPVKQEETLARLSALGRRAGIEDEEKECNDFPPYLFNSNERSVKFASETVALTNKEFELAVFLFQNAGRLLSRKHLMECIWGTNIDLNTRTVDTHLSKLRSKMKLNPGNGWKLSSIYQHGYRLEKIAS